MKVAMISGEIANLTVSKGNGDLVFTPAERRSLGIGAVAAASFGESLSSTSLAGAGAGAEIAMEFFSCTIGNDTVQGNFYKVGFENGQFIDFIVNQWSDKNVLAARDPVRRIVWTAPYRTKGHIAQRKSNILGSILISVAAAIFLFVADYFTGDPERSLRLDSAISQAYISFALMLVLCFFVCKKIFRDSFHSTLIFEALGFIEPAKVDLPKSNQRAEKHYAAETGDQEVEEIPWRFRYDESAVKINRK